MTGTITWHDGTLTLTDDDTGEKRTIEHDEPITAGTNSHEIAAKFGRFDWVDHDGEFIHVGMDGAKHTQGEWKVIGEEYGGEESRIAIGIECEDAGDGGPEFVTVAEVIGREDDEMSDDELQANVNLIKAAPDLLEACEHVIAECEDTFFNVEDMSKEWLALLAELRAAVAKATGKAVQHDA